MKLLVLPCPYDTFRGDRNRPRNRPRPPRLPVHVAIGTHCGARRRRLADEVRRAGL